MLQTRDIKLSATPAQMGISLLSFSETQKQKNGKLSIACCWERINKE
jgi:hypothetical protein